MLESKIILFLKEKGFDGLFFVSKRLWINNCKRSRPIVIKGITLNKYVVSEICDYDLDIASPTFFKDLMGFIK